MKMETQNSIIKFTGGQGQWFTLISVYDLIGEDGEYHMTVPKNLMGMTKEKAISALKWWRRILADKHYPAFIYDPTELSLFNKDGTQNKQIIDNLILKFNGTLPHKVN